MDRSKQRAYWAAFLSSTIRGNRPGPLAPDHAFEYRLGVKREKGSIAMNHDINHFDDNEETLNFVVSDEELEAAASLTNPAVAALSSQNRRNDC
jgi:hypothetical protein